MTLRKFGTLWGPHEVFEKVVFVFGRSRQLHDTHKGNDRQKGKKREGISAPSKVAYGALRLVGYALIEEKSSTTQFHHFMLSTN